MRKIIEFLIIFMLRLAFWFRYRVTVKGLDKLTPEALNKPGGVLFLPNHPAALIDPALATLSVWHKFPIRPLIVEYMYFTTGVHAVMKFLNALPVPDFESSTNSLKRKRSEKVITEVIKGLKSGKENFLLYPAGRLKHTAIEDIGGASATHRIIEEAPEANVVLVRIKGLWGSSFSRALTGRVPPLFPTIWNGIKIAFKNLLFFTPRRHIIIELEPAPADFPYKASRIELNRWLEKWYNRPDGLTKQEGDLPGDSLVLVSYSMWKNQLPEVYTQPEVKEIEAAELIDVPADIQKKVFAKLADLTESPADSFKPEMSLATDLGLDSLDISELAAFLNDHFDVGAISVTELTTVGRLMAIASKKITVEKKEEAEDKSLTEKWKFRGTHKPVQLPPGDTIPEVFLNSCARMGNAPACSDLRSGIVTYSRLKLGVIVLAECIRKLPGKYIGILLPASVGAYMTVLAVQLAGKVPLMINWTIGPRHLKSVVELSQVQAVLTSWAFLERLDKVDLNGIDDMLIMLETMRRDLSIIDKIRAAYRARKSTASILKIFGVDKLTKDDEAVLLFTSGTENVPKGVPLSFENILSNQRSVLEAIEIFSDDCILGMLPPFHGYGFNISGLIGILGGVRITFSPDPTDGKHLAKACKIWGVTQVSGAPTFIKGLIKSAHPDEVGTIRLCVTGAEKAPPELFQLMAQLGKEQCVLEGYGVTEASPVITANRVGKPRKGVGQPVPGVEVIIIDQETHKILPKGEQGLILARGPNIFKGYLNPGIASPFLKVEGKDWYNTGDLGFLDTENRLTISGRKKRFVKAGGEMVSLLGIEHALLENGPKLGWPIESEGPVMAIVGKDQPGGKPLIKLITTFETNVDEANQSLRDSGFSNLVKVSEVIKLNEIPIMGTGKVNHRQLEETYLKDQAAKA